MRALVQRVSEAAVSVDNIIVGQIGPGLVVLMGVTHGDTEEQARYLAQKVIALRIFADENQRMNLDVKAAGGELLIVSQFTLYADTSKLSRRVC